MIPERLKFLVSPDLPPAQLAEVFHRAGKQLFLGGGSVRDAFLERDLEDFEGLPRDGDVPDGDRIFRMPYLDPEGRMTVAQWNTAAFGPDYRLAPLEAVTETFTWRLPDDVAEGPLTVTAEAAIGASPPATASRRQRRAIPAIPALLTVCPSATATKKRKGGPRAALRISDSASCG